MPKQHGETEVALLVCEPRLLSHGKDAWRMFTAAMEFFSTLRALGLDGVALSHYAVDRAAFVATSRRMAQLHMEEGAARCARTTLEGLPLELLSWQRFAPRCSHDV